ncbi:MAG: MMPL family transporter [Streptosporangiaceae bacterium]
MSAVPSPAPRSPSRRWQPGFSIVFGILLDTFFVRTLLVPSIATLPGRWNWWPTTVASGTARGNRPVPWR